MTTAPEPEDRVTKPGSATTTAAVLLLMTGFAQIGFAAAAFAGSGWLEAHVREIEKDPRFGTLYLSLDGWAVLLLVIGLAEVAAGWRLFTRAPYARLTGLAVTLFGVAIAFFTLVLFRGYAVATIVLLLTAMYLLSYRVNA